jgi:ribosomal-protein-alanine N-acetyltransferase
MPLWEARLNASPELIGFCGLRSSEGGSPELLYGLLPRSWGQGLATEVATAVLAYAFSVLGHARVMASTDVPNRASRRLLERLGMTCTGRGLPRGLDTLFFELASTDFHGFEARD